jgi:amino acid adenylation domain-containing protein
MTLVPSALQRFRECARVAPDRVAVRCGDRHVSYGTLGEDVSAVAQELIARGIQADRLVAILLAPGPDWIVAALAVLAAGGAYVPLDPQAPAHWTQEVMDNAGIRALITDRRPARLAPIGGTTIRLPLRPRRIAPAAPVDVPADPRQLAYVMYTSGSTGGPKGVLIERGNLDASVVARLSYYTDPVETFVLVPSLASDSSIAVFFWALCGGGTLAMLSPAQRRDPSAIAQEIERQSATHVLLSPFVYEAMLHGEPRRLDALRVVVVAGDKSQDWLGREHRRLVPRAVLFNEYGPTEATVWCSVHRCSEDEGDTLPIGVAIPGARLSVVGPGDVPADRGELLIGGDGVGRGYLNDPARTAQVFTPDPEGGGARVYRTGDLVRRGPTPALEFLGRGDRQLKIGGNRVELNEVEQTLSAHPALGGAVVTDDDTNAGDRRLVAHCLRASKRTVGPRALIRWAERRLPSYMVPRRILFLDRFPLTSNGKIDRRALRDRGREPVVRRPARAPRRADGTTAARLEVIWRRVLQVPAVAAGDSFQQLGGDSMRAIRLQTMLYHEFDVHVPLADILAQSSFRDMAAFIDVSRHASGRGLVPPPIAPSRAGMSGDD